MKAFWCFFVILAAVAERGLSSKWWDPTASQAPVYQDAQFFNISEKLGFTQMHGNVAAFGDFNSDTLFVSFFSSSDACVGSLMQCYTHLAAYVCDTVLTSLCLITLQRSFQFIYGFQVCLF